MCRILWNVTSTKLDYIENKGHTIIDTIDIIKQARGLLDNKKGENVVILDVRTLSAVTDFHIICTGNNGRHLKALIDDCDKSLAAEGTKHYRLSGTPESGWIILDYMDFVVHVFSHAAREHYALETLWKDAPRIT